MYVEVVRCCGRVLWNIVGHITIAAPHKVVYDCWSTSVSSRVAFTSEKCGVTSTMKYGCVVEISPEK